MKNTKTKIALQIKSCSFSADSFIMQSFVDLLNFFLFSKAHTKVSAFLTVNTATKIHPLSNCEYLFQI